MVEQAPGSKCSLDLLFHRQADLFSIAAATDIHGTKFDDPSNPIAPGGVLDSGIVPATYVSFVDYIDDDQLERFGLHNGTYTSCSLHAVTVLHRAN